MEAERLAAEEEADRIEEEKQELALIEAKKEAAQLQFAEAQRKKVAEENEA